MLLCLLTFGCVSGLIAVVLVCMVGWICLLPGGVFVVWLAGVLGASCH